MTVWESSWWQIIGMIVRAASSNSVMASCLGIDVVRLRTIVFMVGTALAAVGGAVAGPLLPLKLGMGNSIIIDCFVVIILGGLGNIKGAIIGSLVIGMVRALGQQFADSEGWELQNMLTVARVLMGAALRREESRGVHLRSDFPEQDDVRWKVRLSDVREENASVNAPASISGEGTL